MTINEKQDQIIEEFAQLEDWMDKYALIIDAGNTLPAFPETYRTPQHLIEGCQSKVWLHAQQTDGIITFQGDSDAAIVKGIVALLIDVMSNHTADEILAAEPYLIDKIGLKEHLSPTRSNGLLAMLKQIKLYALALKTKTTTQH